MQVAHHGDALDDPLAGKLQHQSQNAMRRGMLRAHVEDELLDLALFDLDRRQRVAGRVFGLAPLDVSGGYDLTTLRNLFA
jgi:hypothetical protein